MPPSAHISVHVMDEADTFLEGMEEDSMMVLDCHHLNHHCCVTITNITAITRRRDDSVTRDGCKCRASSRTGVEWCICYNE